MLSLLFIDVNPYCNISIKNVINTNSRIATNTNASPHIIANIREPHPSCANKIINASQNIAIIVTVSMYNSFFPFMNYTPTKAGGFWEHLVVFRVLQVYSLNLTYRTRLFYHG